MVRANKMKRIVRVMRRGRSIALLVGGREVVPVGGGVYIAEVGVTVGSSKLLQGGCIPLTSALEVLVWVFPL